MRYAKNKNLINKFIYNKYFIKFVSEFYRLFLNY